MKHILPPLPYDHATLEPHVGRSPEMDRWENEGGRLAVIKRLPAPPAAMFPH